MDDPVQDVHVRLIIARRFPSQKVASAPTGHLDDGIDSVSRLEREIK
jgi:hypothetical protein